MKTCVIGCLHLGHESVARFRGFGNSHEHDEYLIRQWNSVINKRDLVYILGDVTMETSEHYYILDRLNGKKRVVLGNHDLMKDVPELLRYVEGVTGVQEYKGFFLTHTPMHPNEVMFCKGNVHAHIHHLNVLPELPVIPYDNFPSELNLGSAPKYFNVDAKLLDFKPLDLTTITNL